MKIPELKQDDFVNDWLDTLNPSENTKRNYLFGLQGFTEWAGKTPKELITEAETEIKAGLLMRERSIKRCLVGYRKYLQSLDIAPMTIKTYMSGAKSFYGVFDIEIPKLPKAGNRALTLEKNKKIPSKEDIQKVLKFADPLGRAVILVGVSSGLSSQEIRNLRVSDFKNGYDSKTEITTFTLRRKKVGYDFTTFLTPEASHAIMDYLELREQSAKQEINNDSNYLFCPKWIKDEYRTSQDESLRQMSNWGIMLLYRRLSQRAAKDTPDGDWNLIRSHNMRKYFNSAMLNAGADSFFVNFTMGHTLNDTDSAYFRATPGKMRDIYLKFIPYLTIQKPLDISESAEYKEIKHENDILRGETASHVVERSEISTMRKELEQMKTEKKENDELMQAIKTLMKNPEFIKNM
jgi:integrase